VDCAQSLRVARGYRRKRFYSTANRILAHLSATASHEPASLSGLTQEGIAAVTHSGRTTATKWLARMETSGLVVGERAHVPGHRVPKTVYRLSHEGWGQAMKLRSPLTSDIVEVLAPGLHPTPLRGAEIPEIFPAYVNMTAAADPPRRPGCLPHPTRPSRAEESSRRASGGGPSGNHPRALPRPARGPDPRGARQLPARDSRPRAVHRRAAPRARPCGLDESPPDFPHGTRDPHAAQGREGFAGRGPPCARARPRGVALPAPGERICRRRRRDSAGREFGAGPSDSPVVRGADRFERERGDDPLSGARDLAHPVEGRADDPRGVVVVPRPHPGRLAALLLRRMAGRRPWTPSQEPPGADDVRRRRRARYDPRIHPRTPPGGAATIVPFARGGLLHGRFRDAGPARRDVPSDRSRRHEGVRRVLGRNERRAPGLRAGLRTPDGLAEDRPHGAGSALCMHPPGTHGRHVPGHGRSPARALGISTRGPTVRGESSVRSSPAAATEDRVDRTVPEGERQGPRASRRGAGSPGGAPGPRGARRGPAGTRAPRERPGDARGGGRPHEPGGRPGDGSLRTRCPGALPDRTRDHRGHPREF